MKIRSLFLIPLCLLILLCSGCSSLIDDKEIHAQTQAMIAGIRAGDLYACMDLLSDSTDARSLVVSFQEMYQLLPETGDYEMTAVQMYRSTSNGIKTTQVRYKLTFEDAAFYADAAILGDEPGLTAFRLIPIEEKAVSGRSPNALSSYTPLQWFILCFGLMGYAFMLWMFIDCLRRKIQLKWLWCLVILLGTFIVAISQGNGSFSASANLGLFFNYTALTLRDDGGFMLRICFPLGAVIYCILRRSLTAKACQAARPSEAPLPTDPDNSHS